MGKIRFYKNPEDILFKILREGRRTWLAENIEDKCDHFFNFCVTAQALRDWCIKYLKLIDQKEKEIFHEEINKHKYFKECRDLANSSKHFTLTKDNSSVISTKTLFSEFRPLTGFDNSNYLPSKEKLDINIILSDETVCLFEFLHFIALGWIEIFKIKKIPLADGADPIIMYMEDFMF